MKLAGTCSVLSPLAFLFLAVIGFGPRLAFSEPATTVPACFEKRPNMLPPALCIRNGTSYSGGSVPIYVIMIGDTLPAERLINRWSHLGHWSLDATLYVRPADKPTGTWKKALYRRPKGVKQTQEWFGDKKAFHEEAYGDVALLPEVFRDLPEGELAKIYTIVAYLDGTTKVYLVDDTTAASAEVLLAAIVARMPAVPSAPAPKAPALPRTPRVPRNGTDA